MALIRNLVEVILVVGHHGTEGDEKDYKSAVNGQFLQLTMAFANALCLIDNFNPNMDGCFCFIFRDKEL